MRRHEEMRRQFEPRKEGRKEGRSSICVPIPKSSKSIGDQTCEQLHTEHGKLKKKFEH